MEDLVSFSYTEEGGNETGKRLRCDRCRRPVTVCWCPFLPHPRPVISTNVIVLQHPFEVRRRLSTTPMLLHGLPEGKCEILQGKRFNLTKWPVLAEAIKSPNTLLLFPGDESLPVASFSPDNTYNLIVLDGTWPQAEGIYTKNDFLHNLTKVTIEKPPISKYVVRTQPTDECVSTLESVALALESLENNKELFEILTKPLTALCDYQLSHGAVKHQSKDYLIRNGLYKSQTRKPTQKPQ